VARDRFRALAAEGAPVAIDDTNCFRWLRDRWRALAEPLGYQVTVLYLPTPHPEIERRRAASTDRPLVREEIRPPLAAFEPPAADERTETMRAGEDPDAFAARVLGARSSPPSSTSDPG